MRWMYVTFLTLAACGGEPTAPSPAFVVLQSVVPQVDPRAVRVTVRNTGGDGQFRVTQRDGTGTARCQSGGTLINGGVSTTATFPCAAVIEYVTVEVQDGANPAWRRSACYAMDQARQAVCATLRE
jgi:hypothetical protein